MPRTYATLPREHVMKHPLWLMLSGLLLTSCMAAGVPYTKDPHNLMMWAMHMHEKGRAWRMKQFIDLAHDSYVQKQDQLGIAETYRLYGKYYRFHPENAVIDHDYDPVLDRTQLEKSLTYYRQALDIFQSLQKWGHAALTAAEVGQAYMLLDEKDKTYASYDQAINLYEKFLQSHSPREFPYQLVQADFYEFVRDQRQLAGKNREGKTGAVLNSAD